MSPEENLITLIRKWREGVKSARAESGEIRSKNPYGQKIHDLNLEWGATQRAHREKIRDEQARYNATRQELLAQSAAWKKEYAQGGSKTPTNGRPKSPDYSDEVKIAAAKALRSGSTKTIIRVLMGADTARLNRALTEGEALLKAQEAEEEW